MWEMLGKILLSAGVIGLIAALASKLARKSADLEQAEREAAEREKVDKIMDTVSVLGRDECLERLRGRDKK